MMNRFVLLYVRPKGYGSKSIPLGNAVVIRFLIPSHKKNMCQLGTHFLGASYAA